MQLIHSITHTTGIGRPNTPSKPGRLPSHPRLSPYEVYPGQGGGNCPRPCLEQQESMLLRCCWRHCQAGFDPRFSSESCRKPKSKKPRVASLTAKRAQQSKKEEGIFRQTRGAWICVRRGCCIPDSASLRSRRSAFESHDGSARSRHFSSLACGPQRAPAGFEPLRSFKRWRLLVQNFTHPHFLDLVWTTLASPSVVHFSRGHPQGLYGKRNSAGRHVFMASHGKRQC